MVPIEMLRQYRFNGYAIFDFIAVFVGFYLLAPLLSKVFSRFSVDIRRKNWLFLSLPIGIVVHVMAGKITPMTRDFLDLKGHYLLKLVIFSLFILGLRGIRRAPKQG